MDPIENKGFMLFKIFEVLQKGAGNLCIMQTWVEVMNRMVSVIPTILVVHIVDTVEYATEMSFRITFINKTMLCPVAHHHNKTSIDQRNDEDHKCRFEIDKAHGYTKSIKGNFSY